MSTKTLESVGWLQSYIWKTLKSALTPPKIAYISKTSSEIAFGVLRKKVLPAFKLPFKTKNFEIGSVVVELQAKTQNVEYLGSGVEIQKV